MQGIKNENNQFIERISPIVNQLFKSNSLYQTRLKKEEMLEMLVNLSSKFSPEEFTAISDSQLAKRIDKILVLEAVAGTLNDLTPEQIKIFDEAVCGR